MRKNNLFYNRLLEQVRLRNTSINQIERELGYPRNALHNYKLGREPSATRLVELANYFDVSPQYLIGENNEIPERSLEMFFKKLSIKDKKEILRISVLWFLKQIK
ncbi:MULTISPECIES: helix-turn-helix domain-containing protein [Lactococcus]|jgi:transcriptional regulator with XRE-family HTH domain|uniref:XRE family transcriptional regulator n=1 Tax=Lactococcus lactis subsp. lactis TaxID=1360 RepID=A0A2Z3KM07_LACLL|nr:MULTISPECIES: helix-turn-helix transcriptional regulator [Lactococcus]AWN65403.1 XRE family transcriptional regulator [Lactococcus lactis subsp. lactis]KGF76210.1 transcription regulator [Lactococcus lactis]MBK0030640.1 helix-turn-helix transcriptional regulator [Lactococcus sp. S47]MCA2391308.1 helix-turn-helix domain-containing protein [Lactococcus sp. NH2-7C]MCI1072672.1 helix-turn-helix domain-containing protein [Lactococcus lactis]